MLVRPVLFHIFSQFSFLSLSFIAIYFSFLNKVEREIVACREPTKGVIVGVSGLI